MAAVSAVAARLARVAAPFAAAVIAPAVIAAITTSAKRASLASPATRPITTTARDCQARQPGEHTIPQARPGRLAECRTGATRHIGRRARIGRGAAIGEHPVYGGAAIGEHLVYRDADLPHEQRLGQHPLS